MLVEPAPDLLIILFWCLIIYAEHDDSFPEHGREDVVIEDEEEEEEEGDEEREQATSSSLGVEEEDDIEDDALGVFAQHTGTWPCSRSCFITALPYAQ